MAGGLWVQPRQQSQEGHCKKGYTWNGTDCVPIISCPMVTEWNGISLGREYCVNDIQFLQDFLCANCLSCDSTACEDNPYTWCPDTPSRACYYPLEIGDTQIWYGGRLIKWNHNGYYNDDIWEGFVPDSISNLTELKKLWLQSNELQGAIPESICEILPNLEIFYIHSNQFCDDPPFPMCIMSGLVDGSITLDQVGNQDCGELSPHREELQWGGRGRMRGGSNNLDGS